MSEEMKRQEYGLGACRVYIGTGSATEDDVIENGVSLGETDGGCTLTYEYRSKDLLDTEGEVAAVLRYGEKAWIRGKLCRISEAAAELLTSGRVSVLLLCPLPDGSEFCTFLKGCAASKAKWIMSASGGVEFEIGCGRGFTHPKLIMKESV